MNNIFGFIDYRSRDMVKHPALEAVLLNLPHLQFYVSHKNPDKKAHIAMYNHLILAFNGTLYNRSLLEKMLSPYGYPCHDKNDSEVVAFFVDAFGLSKTVQVLEGSFAFVLFNRHAQKLYLVRDKAGIKMLYYYQIDDLILFGTKLKYFTEFPLFEKQIDNNALALYFQYRYIPQPYTIFQHCRKVKAGHYAAIDIRQRSSQTEQYWDVIDVYKQPKLHLSEKEILLETERLIKASLSKRVPEKSRVGTFLSGGYDSATIACFLQQNSTEKIKTYTIGFEEGGFDEAPFAKSVAEYLNTDHTEYYLTSKDVRDTLPLFYAIYEEPFGDCAAIPTILINQFASGKIDLLFGGEGGDEIFASSSAIKRYSLIHHIPSLIKSLMVYVMQSLHPEKKLHANLHHEFISRYDKWLNMLQVSSVEESIRFKEMYMTQNQVSKLLLQVFSEIKTDFEGNRFIKNMHYLDKVFPVILKTFVCNALLYKVGNASNYYHIENKAPFLDLPFMTFMAQVDPALKYKNGIKKYIQKQVVHHYIPQEIMDRPKNGFSVPITCWMQDQLKDIVLDYLHAERIKNENILNPVTIENIKNSFFSADKRHDSQVIWNILMFEIWYEKWMR